MSWRVVKPMALDSEFFFFFNDTATTEIYTLSLHDALPISHGALILGPVGVGKTHLATALGHIAVRRRLTDRKSTRLNSSHSQISYAVFCLKKKKHRVPVPILAVLAHRGRRTHATLHLRATH